MKKQTIRRFILAGIAMIIVLMYSGCGKDDPKNPYDDIPPVVENDNPDADDLPEGSFAWLHAKVFRPTCANSGCHDGTFEPEFRTMASTYNSLVYHPVIANDESNSFVHRVVPGNADASFLHERLTTFVPNTSGIMPLDTEPGSDWPDNSTMYIQKIAAWINDGAKDMLGNPAPSSELNMPPMVYGIAAFPHNNTTTPYERETESEFGIGSILVPNALVDIWIFPFDDNAGLNNFESIELKASESPSEFTNPISSLFEVQGTPVVALDFGNSAGQFYYKATLDLSGAASGETWFLRTYLDDGAQPQLTEIPNDASIYFWYLLFSLKIQ